MVLLNIGQDCGRQHGRSRAPAQGISDRRRGHRKLDIREVFHGDPFISDPFVLVRHKGKGRIQRAECLLDRRCFDVVPLDDKKTHQSKKFRGPVPMRQVDQGIGTDDEKIAMPTVAFNEGLHRVEGVGWQRQFLFDQRDLYPLFVRAFGEGSSQHGRPMGKGGQGLPFVRRLGRWNEKEGVQLATVKDMTSKSKMPLMHGIKGPAEQTDMLMFPGGGHASDARLPRTVDDEFTGGQLL